MKEKLESLLKDGFKPYRKIRVGNSVEFEFVEQSENIYTEYLPANFNVMKPGGTAIWLIKDKEKYYFGLDEFGKPPILIKEE